MTSQGVYEGKKRKDISTTSTRLGEAKEPYAMGTSRERKSTCREPEIVLAKGAVTPEDHLEKETEMEQHRLVTWQLIWEWKAKA